MEIFKFSLIEQGGPIMWVLLGVSLFGFILFVERTLFLHRGQIRTEEFLDGIKNLLKKGRKIEVLTLCEDIPGPVSGMVKAIILRSEESEDKIRQAAESAALVEIPILERRLGTMAAVARISPLIGLIGTVMALIESFVQVGEGSMAAYPTFGFLLGGIGEALITTAAGLMISVMATSAHHFLSGRVRALVHDLEYTAHELILFLASNEEDEASLTDTSEINGAD